MARRRRAEKRPVSKDLRFGSQDVSLLISKIMSSGKYSTAETIVYGALDTVQEKTGSDPMEVLNQALNNAKPRLEVKSRRVGGATYQVPVEVDSARQTALAMRWLVQYSKARKGVPMKRALALEIMDAAKNQGNAIKKRDDTHKMAQANKAFAHYRW
ncbi:MAG TPA: 30S ribosomal protein S7 [Kiritimatiellia bacterium]|nr:30S ribosomal protein S7 [Kiritimatiellia bacterium]